MRLYWPLGLCAMPLAMLSACHQGVGKGAPSAGGGDAASPKVVAGAASPSATASAGAGAGQEQPKGAARKVSEESALYEFDYSYPAAAGAIPALKSWLDADLSSGRSDLIAEAKQGKADAKASGYPYNAYSAGTAWQAVTELPGWLSLSAQVYDYSGGAHPNHGYNALLWDKHANRQRKALDLFLSKAALSGAIRPRFCNLLDKERTLRRGEPVNRDSGDEFDQCIDPVEEVVILGSAGHKAFDRIGILIAPYEAGPYAEGDYEITLPVTPAVLAAVRPEYRASFALGR